MIFKPRLARMVLRGKKTQTRRPAKWAAADDAAGKPSDDQRVVQVPYDYEGPKILIPCRYKLGSDYALQTGRGKPAEPGWRLVVTEVRGPEPVKDITLEDAIAEGFKTRQDFFDYWHELYDKPNEPADMDLPVWVISLRAKREDRYLPVWVGQGEASGKTGTTDYTHGGAGALKEAGQAVPEDYQEQITKEAGERWKGHMETERAEEVARQEMRSVIGMVRQTAIEAGRQGLDTRPFFEDLKAKIAGMRDQLDKAA